MGSGPLHLETLDGSWPKQEGRPVEHGLYRKLDITRIDGRTELGKAVNALRSALQEFVPEPTPFTDILIQRIIYKHVRLTLYETRMLCSDDPGDLANEVQHYSQISNGLRTDLQTLANLAGKPKDETPDLAQYVNKKYGKKNAK